MALYRLSNPTICSKYPIIFNIGTTIVNGIENDDSIDVIVDMYMELQAPPEQIVNGIDKFEKMLRSICFKREFCVIGREGSIRLKNAYDTNAKIRN